MTTDTEKAVRDAQATPEEIAAAWKAWHSRHGGKLGPGPAFIEAINAAFAVRASELDAVRAERDRLRVALEEIADDAESPQQIYDRIGPQWTSANGDEYESTGSFLAKCNELAASARAALSPALESTHGK